MSKSLIATLASAGLFASLIPATSNANDANQPGIDATRALVSVTAAYESGNYGSVQTTRVESLTSDLDWYVTDSTILSLSLPFLIQEAPRGTVGGGGHGGGSHRGNNRGVRTPVVTTSGIGDLVLGIDQDLLEQSSNNPVDIGAFAGVKFGTADVHKGLGSGKDDFSFGGRMSHDWDRYQVGGELGYTVVGKPETVTANGVSTTLNYRNAAFGSIGGAYGLNERTTLGIELSSLQSYERRRPSTNTINASVKYRANQQFKLKGAVLAGLNNNSPDFGLSLTAGWAF